MIVLLTLNSISLLRRAVWLVSFWVLLLICVFRPPSRLLHFSIRTLFCICICIFNVDSHNHLCRYKRTYIVSAIIQDICMVGVLLWLRLPSELFHFSHITLCNSLEKIVCMCCFSWLLYPLPHYQWQVSTYLVRASATICISIQEDRISSMVGVFLNRATCSKFWWVAHLKVQQYVGRRKSRYRKGEYIC